MLKKLAIAFWAIDQHYETGLIGTQRSLMQNLGSKNPENQWLLVSERAPNKAVVWGQHPMAGCPFWGRTGLIWGILPFQLVRRKPEKAARAGLGWVSRPTGFGAVLSPSKATTNPLVGNGSLWGHLASTLLPWIPLFGPLLLFCFSCKPSPAMGGACAV